MLSPIEQYSLVNVVSLTLIVLINDSVLLFLGLLGLSQDANSVIKGVQLINAAVMHSTGYADAKVIIAT